MSKPWIVINFCQISSPFIWNLLGISKPYVLWSSKDKFQNSCLNNKVFPQGKCWQQFIMQHVAPTLHIDSSNNTFSILKMEPSKSTTLGFFIWKEHFFFFTPIALTSSTSSMWVSLNAMRWSLKGYPSWIIWTNSHFQMVIFANIVAKQYKMQNPTWSSPSWSSRTVSYGSHATTQPSIMKTPPSFIRSHSALRCSNRCLPAIFEFVPLTQWPCTTSSIPCAFPWL